MTVRPDEIERQHNRGQEDAAAGQDPNPPHDWGYKTWNTSNSNDKHDAYMSGYEHTRSQKEDD